MKPKRFKGISEPVTTVASLKDSETSLLHETEPSVCAEQPRRVHHRRQHSMIHEAPKPLRSYHKRSVSLNSGATTNKSLSAQEALRVYASRLANYERKEIQSYENIYYLGIFSQKVVPNPSLENFGFSVNGSYNAINHDQVAFRYEIVNKIAEGNFASVFEAFDHKKDMKVAIKAIKNQYNFRTYAKSEISILLKILNNNSESSTTELLDHFKFRNHQFLVFPLYHMNLYEYLTQKSRLSLDEIRKLGPQILKGLSEIHKLGLMHCDLKPENIMFTDRNCNELKLIDYGASSHQERVFFYYVQSRPYRSPDVVLGAKFSTAIDIWSFGCILVELITGNRLFYGDNNHQLLLNMMEFLGFPPRQFLVKCKLVQDYFYGPKTLIVKQGAHGKDTVPASRSLLEIIPNDPAFIDLVKQCLQWNPNDRISAEKALKHPFFNPEEVIEYPKYRKLSSLSKL